MLELVYKLQSTWMTTLVFTTPQLHSIKPELRFCAGSNPPRGVSEIRDGEDLWRLVSAGNKVKTSFVGQPYHKNNSSSSPSYFKIISTL